VSVIGCIVIASWCTSLGSIVLWSAKGKCRLPPKRQLLRCALAGAGAYVLLLVVLGGVYTLLMVHVCVAGIAFGVGSGRRRYGHSGSVTRTYCGIAFLLSLLPWAATYQSGEETPRTLAASQYCREVVAEANQWLHRLPTDDLVGYDAGPLFESGLWQRHAATLTTINQQDLRAGYLEIPVSEREWHTCVTGMYRLRNSRRVLFYEGGKPGESRIVLRDCG